MQASTKMTSTNNQLLQFEKLINRMGRAYYSYVIWKSIKRSISIPEVGFNEASQNSFALNKYGGIFSGLLYATENTFINDLYKFFDKTKNTLKIDSITKNIKDNETKKRITELQNSIKEEFVRVKTLRHSYSAHESLNPVEEKIYTEEVEKIFNTLKEILNILSVEVGDKNTYEWQKTETEDSFKKLLEDLKK